MTFDADIYPFPYDFSSNLIAGATFNMYTKFLEVDPTYTSSFLDLRFYANEISVSAGPVTTYVVIPHWLF